MVSFTVSATSLSLKVVSLFSKAKKKYTRLDDGREVILNTGRILLGGGSSCLNRERKLGSSSSEELVTPLQERWYCCDAEAAVRTGITQHALGRPVVRSGVQVFYGNYYACAALRSLRFHDAHGPSRLIYIHM